MGTEQVDLRLDAEIVAALEQLAETAKHWIAPWVMRRLLVEGVKRWQRSNALASYQRGEISIGRAAEQAGVSVWEALAMAREAANAHPGSTEDVNADMDALSLETDAPAGEGEATLADVTPVRGGVLLVGINPVAKSVAAGHGYQGTFGRRPWQRLERLDLLTDPQPGAEDIAFTAMGHGLTDVVKQPTKAAREVSAQELRLGAAELRGKIARWQPVSKADDIDRQLADVLGALSPTVGDDGEGRERSA